MNDKVLELAAAKDAKRKEIKISEHLYKISKGVICRVKNTADEYQEIPLCNFTARITEEIIRDNGIDKNTIFIITGQLADGNPLPKVEVTADKFSSMNWITVEWGTRAVVYAGSGTKDHLRAAIQLLSLQENGDLPRRIVYSHIGWRKIGNQWVYLHNGGALGSKGRVEDIEVDAGQQLSSYVLPQPAGSNDLRKAIIASLSLFKITKTEVAYPVLAAIYRAPLGELLPIDMSIFIVGPTGAQKSELTAIMQAHWGNTFTGKNLPANWVSTGNSLEKLAFLAKDAILVIDDFVPQGSSMDIQKFHREADRILRSQGNNAGRLRMNADGSLKPAYYPRGLIVASGEDMPHGQSLAARMIILELNRGDVDLSVLSEMQEMAASGILTQVMSGYIMWLAPQIDELKKSLPQRKNEFRGAVRKSGVTIHDRTPDNIASLMIGLEQFLNFAVSAKALTQAEAENMFREGFEALLSVGQKQAQYQRAEDPTERFISLLSTAITTGLAHITDAKTNSTPDEPTQWGWERDAGGYNYRAKGTLIGWLDGNNLLLEPDAAYAAAQRIARDQNTSIAISQRTLWKRMQQKGLLLSYEEGRLKQRWYIAGARKRVIHVSKFLLVERMGPENGTSSLEKNKKWSQNRGLKTPENRHMGPVGPEGPVFSIGGTKNFSPQDAKDENLDILKGEI